MLRFILIIIYLFSFSFSQNKNKTKEVVFSNYESIEEYLTSKGHNLSNCEWMTHESSKIVDETGDLPF